jgi:HEAT repeats
VNRLDGDRLKSARQALADRLTRMTADTLRAMAKSDEPELRRATAIAMAQKDDKVFVPDLIAAIIDDEEVVVRAARAALKSLTGQDFGPRSNADIGERKIARDIWKNWWDKQK